MRLIAEVLSQLRGHRPLHQPARQISEQAAGPDNLLLGSSAGEQLVNQLIRELIADLGRGAVQAPPRRARSASGSLG